MGSQPVPVARFRDFLRLLSLWKGGHVVVVQWLLDHGADPNMQVSDGTPLDDALSLQDVANKTVEILKAHGAKSIYLHPN